MTSWPLHQHCRIPDALNSNNNHISFQNWMKKKWWLMVNMHFCHQPQKFDWWRRRHELYRKIFVFFSMKESPIKSCRRFLLLSKLNVIWISIRSSIDQKFNLTIGIKNAAQTYTVRHFEYTFRATFGNLVESKMVPLKVNFFFLFCSKFDWN